MPNLKKGHYQLKISIPVSFWWPVKRHGTHCLSFDFVMEYIPSTEYKRKQSQFKRSTQISDKDYDDADFDADTEDDTNPFTLISVIAPKGNW